MQLGKKKRREGDIKGITRARSPVKSAYISIRRSASFHESIVNTAKAGLLACNIFAALPIPEYRNSGLRGQKLSRYIQLRDSLWFSHNSLLTPVLSGDLLCLIKKLRKELYGCKASTFCRFLLILRFALTRLPCPLTVAADRIYVFPSSKERIPS